MALESPESASRATARPSDGTTGSEEYAIHEDTAEAHSEGPH